MVCDFAAVYRLRIDPERGDFAGLTGPQFLRLASRLPAYPGVMRIRVEHSHDDNQPQPASAGQAHTQMLEASPLMLRTHPLLAEFVDYTTASPEPVE